MFIRQESTGKVVQGGYWMDMPEDERKQSWVSYVQKPIEQRAAQEMQEQLSYNWEKEFQLFGGDGRMIGVVANPMKFIIFSQSGLALGTVTAPTRDSAIDKLRGQTSKFGTRTTQSLYLYPYPSANVQTRYVADQGVQA